MPGDRRRRLAPRPGARERRAISDALGFVLVFAIVVSILATVYIGGFQSLDNAREFERMNNAQRAFEVFADNVEDITQRGAPSRATEIKLAEASVYMGDPVYLNVTVGGAHVNTSVVPIVYEGSSGNELVYTSGAVMRTSGEGSSMAVEPTMVLGDEHAAIPVVQTRSGGGEDSISGSTTVLIRTEKVGPPSGVVQSNTTGTQDVTIELSDTDRAGSWERYFEKEGADTCSSTATSVTCTFDDVEQVYVNRVVIDVSFA